jgi:hypothetical protein
MNSDAPKALQLAELAYNAYWKEQPPIWFSDLGHEYQMRWVHVVRAVSDGHKKYTGRGRALGSKMPPKTYKAVEVKQEEDDEDTFWTDIKTMPRDQFLEKHVPRTMTGTKFSWKRLPKAKRTAARRVFWRQQKRDASVQQP